MVKKTFAAVAAILCSAMIPAFGQGLDACFTSASARYSVPKPILVAIASVESGMRPSAYRRNRNGTEDIGIMQINTSHLPKLKRWGVKKRDLWNPCTNIMVGAWILADGIRRKGWRWEAVGEYHSPTPARQKWYIQKVYQAYRRLYGS